MLQITMCANKVSFVIFKCGTRNTIEAYNYDLRQLLNISSVKYPMHGVILHARLKHWCNK